MKLNSRWTFELAAFLEPFGKKNEMEQTLELLPCYNLFQGSSEDSVSIPSGKPKILIQNFLQTNFAAASSRILMAFPWNF